jgi:hypothetical protein
MQRSSEGKTYEALVLLALELLKKDCSFDGEIYWNVTPEGMTIEPDLVVGHDPNRPSHIFLITYSITAPKSNMKLWRNLGELAEAKTRLKTVPWVGSVTFGEGTRGDIKRLQAQSFDGQLVVDDQEYGKEIHKWISDHAYRFPRDGGERVAYIRECCLNDHAIRRLLEQLADDLGSVMQTQQTAPQVLWQLERHRSIGPIPLCRTTYVRRGLAKLLLFSREHLTQIIGGQRLFPDSETIIPAKFAGIVTRTLGGYRLVDAEVLNALKLLSREQVQSIFDCPRAVGLEAVISQAKNIVALERMCKALWEHYEDLITPEGMFQALQRQYKDSMYLLNPFKGNTPADVWLFRLLMDVFKLFGGTMQAYGTGKLVDAIKKYSTDPKFISFVRKVALMEFWEFPKSTEPIRRGLQDYINRIPNTSFSSALLAAVSYGLAVQLATIARERFVGIHEKLIETWRSSTVEARLLTHLEFDPLKVLIVQALNTKYTIEYVKGCFAEASGNLTSTLTGRTRLIRTRSCLINWQSAHDSHTNDKRKELCGRAVALRYSWEARSRGFIRRPGVKKLILVLDGTWRQVDLDTLVRAGWDEVFYPDEMDKLVQAIA